VPYEQASQAAAGLSVSAKNSMQQVIQLRRSWTMRAIEQYQRARKLAQAGR